MEKGRNCGDVYACVRACVRACVSVCVSEWERERVRERERERGRVRVHSNVAVPHMCACAYTLSRTCTHTRQRASWFTPNAQ